MKRSRARFPIGGQSVLLQISLRIKIFDFFSKQQELEYESHLTSTSTYENIRNQAESRKNSKKKYKNLKKSQDVDKSTLAFVFQQLFCVPSWSLAQKKMVQNCFENVISELKKILICPKCTLKKSFCKLMLHSVQNNFLFCSKYVKVNFRFF